ncbi:MAG: MotE family protein [Pseudomonadota bacterium]
MKAIQIIGAILVLSTLLLPVRLHSQTVELDPAETSFREDFMILDTELDSMKTGSVRKREEIFKYCLNISDRAKEARYLVIKNRLQMIEGDVDRKLGEMEARIKELKTWTERREQFLNRANETLVGIFRTMRADAAALQMTELGPATAASIISKLEPKLSSAILAEMEPNYAAKITMVLTSAMATNGKS